MKDDLHGKENMEDILRGASGDERALSDEEIGELLFSDDDMLPEAAVKRISPTRRAFLLTVWGLALSALQLPLFEKGMQFAFNEYSEHAMGFPYLGILIPLAGLLLSFFGLRALKKTNRSFGFSWLLCFVRAAIFILGLVFTFGSMSRLKPVKQSGRDPCKDTRCTELFLHARADLRRFRGLSQRPLEHRL